MKNSNKWLIALTGTLFLGFSSALAQQNDMHCVAKNDCGVSGKQSFLVTGQNYTLPKSIKGSKGAVTCNYGGKVIYAFNQMDIRADYKLEVVYLADAPREQHIVVDGNEIQTVKLEAHKEQRYMIDLPRKSFAYGQLVCVFELNGKGANALVSEVNLYSSNPKAPIPFEGDAKEALKKVVTYKVNKNIDVEKVIPVYCVLPKAVSGTYQPTLSLNGAWKFNPAPSKDFYKKPADSEWKTIAVPGQWSMQKYAHILKFLQNISKLSLLKSP